MKDKNNISVCSLLWFFRYTLFAKRYMGYVNFVQKSKYEYDDDKTTY